MCLSVSHASIGTAPQETSHHAVAMGRNVLPKKKSETEEAVVKIPHIGCCWKVSNSLQELSLQLRRLSALTLDVWDTWAAAVDVKCYLLTMWAGHAGFRSSIFRNMMDLFWATIGLECEMNGRWEVVFLLDQETIWTFALLTCTIIPCMWLWKCSPRAWTHAPCAEKSSWKQTVTWIVHGY